MDYTYKIIANIEDIHCNHIYSKIQWNSRKVQNKTQVNLDRIVDEISENKTWNNPWHELAFRISMSYEKNISPMVLKKIEKRQEKQRKHNLKTYECARNYHVN